MKISGEMLTRLLKGEHFGMECRRRLGLWPSEPLRYADLVAHLARVLETVEWFPFEIPVSAPGEPVREGIYVRREAADRYVCVTHRTMADHPLRLAGHGERVFHSSYSAAEYYLKWELNLPGRLDGWLVV